MKKSTISMMVIGMMMTCTTTSFGKTNGQPRENGNNSPRMEQRENGQFRNNNDRNGGKDFHMRPVEHRGDMGHKPEPRPVPKPEPRHHNSGSDVVTGVVVGTVIGGIISSLVK